MPRPARLLPRLPPRAAACPAPSPRSRPIRGCIPCPSPPMAEGGTRAFAHAGGKVPGVTRRRVGEPVTLRLVPTLPPPVTTRGTVAEAPEALADPRLGHSGSRRARTHARTRCTPVRVPPASPAARSRGPGAGSRARAARRVRERALARAVRSAGARPSRTEKPARPPPRRSLGKQRGPAPVGLLRAQSLPPRTAPGGGCSCTGRGTDASSRGQGCFWSVGDVSQGPGGN